MDFQKRTVFDIFKYKQNDAGRERQHKALNQVPALLRRVCSTSEVSRSATSTTADVARLSTVLGEPPTILTKKISQ